MIMKLEKPLQNLLTDIMHWAKTQEDIKAVALVGSYARNLATAESDVDLVILAKNHKQYLEEVSWLNRFGELSNYRRQRYGKVTSLHVNYKNSYEVEFGFTTSKWAIIPPDKGTRKVIEDGIKVLYDPGYLLTKLIAFVQQDELECDKMYKDVRL